MLGQRFSLPPSLSSWERRSLTTSRIYPFGGPCRSPQPLHLLAASLESEVIARSGAPPVYRDQYRRSH